VRRIHLVAALLVGCASQLAPSVRTALEFRVCEAGFDCAELRVPVDHARPDAGELSLAILRRPAQKPAERIGVLIVNPGGPGISAVDHLRGSASRYGAALRERFDLVAFDTRGTGASARLDCHESLDSYLAQDPTPDTDAEWASAVAASRAFAEECARKHVELLPFMGTGESAGDMDLVRAALGEEQISYIGFSYGTALGASYARRFPGRVRAMVLDGAIDPSFDLLLFAREQAVAVEQALTAYDAEAQKKGWHGLTVFEAVSARAELAPVPNGAGARPARASDILYGSVEAVTDPGAGWHELNSALDAAQAGDGAPFVRLSDRYFGRESDGSSALCVETQLAVLCADLHRLASAEAYRDAITELEHTSPHIGVANLMSLLPCAFWVPPARPLEPLRAVEAAGILVVAGREDPLTPHVWGERLAEQLPMATLFSVETQEHTAFGRGRACVDEVVVSVLLSGKRPVPMPVCP
jgi:pimeloyl-ACP methyl ester carboxylesterase